MGLQARRAVFGNTPAMSDDLLALVLMGRKMATCWAAIHGDLGTMVGQRVTVVDGQGRDSAVIETTELALRRFDQIDAEWAAAEGEDDLTLESWLRSHEAYFRGEGVFAPDMPLWCERFRLIEVLGHGPIQ
jgi:uncharacterized protein YhfF